MTDVYRHLGLSEGTGAIRAEYERAGKTAYEAHARASGEHEVLSWGLQVWAVQYAWCEAARAAREAA